MKGKVKWFNPNKGFGFLISEDKKEYFAHWNSIVAKSNTEYKTLEQDDEVEFDVIKTDKGVQAVNIIRLK